jgi:hypothetical protein
MDISQSIIQERILAEQARALQEGAIPTVRSPDVVGIPKEQEKLNRCLIENETRPPAEQEQVIVSESSVPRDHIFSSDLNSKLETQQEGREHVSALQGSELTEKPAPLNNEIVAQMTEEIKNKYGPDEAGLQDAKTSVETDEANQWGKAGERQAQREYEPYFEKTDTQVTGQKDSQGGNRIGDFVFEKAKEDIVVNNVLTSDEGGNVVATTDSVAKGESMAVEVKNGKSGYLEQQLGTSDGHGIRQVEAAKNAGHDHVYVNVTEDFLDLPQDTQAECIKNVENAGGKLRVGLPHKEEQINSVLKSLAA